MGSNAPIHNSTSPTVALVATLARRTNSVMLALAKPSIPWAATPLAREAKHASMEPALAPKGKWTVEALVRF